MSQSYLTMAVVWGLAIGTMHAQEQNNSSSDDRPRSSWAAVLACAACISKPICDIAAEETLNHAVQNVVVVKDILTKNLSPKDAADTLATVLTIAKDTRDITTLRILSLLANGVCIAGVAYFFYQNVVVDLMHYFKQSQQNKENHKTTTEV